RAEVRLLTGVERRDRPEADRVEIVVAKLPCIGAVSEERRIRRGTRAVTPVVLVTNIPADLQADVGARDVIETSPIQAADLHVFHGLGLEGKCGGPRPSICAHSRRTTEEKAFHHLHLEPPKMSSFRRVPSLADACASIEGTLSPQSPDILVRP